MSENNVVRGISYESMNDTYKNKLVRMIAFTLFLSLGVFVPFIIGMLPLEPISQNPLVLVFCSAGFDDLLVLMSMLLATACNILFWALPFLERGKIHFENFDLKKPVKRVSEEINNFYNKAVTEEKMIIQREEIVYAGKQMPYLLVQYTIPNLFYRKLADSLFFLWFAVSLFYVVKNGGIIANINFLMKVYPYLIFIFFAFVSNSKYEENINMHRAIFDEKELDDYYYVSKNNYTFSFVENNNSCSRKMCILVLAKYQVIEKVLYKIADCFEKLKEKVFTRNRR